MNRFKYIPKPLVFLALSLLFVSPLYSNKESVKAPEVMMPKKHIDFLDYYCMDCHDTASQKGKVDLETLSFEIKSPRDAERWQKVLNAVNAGEMPPKKKDQPEEDEKADFLEDLAGTMVKARKLLADSGGHITMRRLNRREYQNSIKELLDIELDVSDLPNDQGVGGFDTVGSALFMSPDQIETYHRLGRKALEEHFASQKPITTVSKHRVQPEIKTNVSIKKSLKEAAEKYKKFMAYKAKVDAAAKLKVNEKVTQKLLKNKGKFYFLANLLKGAPKPMDYGFQDAQEAAAFFMRVQYTEYNKRYLKLPKINEGAYLKIYANPLNIAHQPWNVLNITPKNIRHGKYILRLRVASVEGTSKSRHFIEVGHVTKNKKQSDVKGPSSIHHVTGTMDNPEILEIPFEINDVTKYHTTRIRDRLQILNRTALMFNGLHAQEKKKNGVGIDAAIWVDWLEIEGPFPLEKKSTLSLNLDKSQNENVQARKIITKFAMRAFRGITPDKDYLDGLVEIFKEQHLKVKSFEKAIIEPLSIVLTSPNFLYRGEEALQKKGQYITQRELAVRLSYFLWSSPPDKELLSLAKSGQLAKKEVLIKQVDRLLDDKRSKAFIEGFVQQWLGMERLDFFQFNRRLYPAFDGHIKESARQEVYESFKYLLDNNDKLNLLLNSDHIMANGALAIYYGIDGVTGDEFRKVKLPKNSPRGGLLGMAAIMAMGSDGEHTSPVERGAWVLRHMLNTPPPPAPANVPQISRLEGKILTTRERLSAHQEKAQCASCHRKIDPIGLGLENFNAVGQWRTKNSYSNEKLAKENKKLPKSKRKTAKKIWKIDSSGTLHNGPEFSTYFELRDLIANKEKDFAKGFLEALIEYSMGRPFGFSDELMAEGILKDAEKNDYRIRNLIHNIIQSKAFNLK